MATLCSYYADPFVDRVCQSFNGISPVIIKPKAQKKKKKKKKEGSITVLDKYFSQWKEGREIIKLSFLSSCESITRVSH